MGLSLGDIEKRTGDQTMVRRARISLGELNKASKSAGADLTRGLLECGVEVDSSYSLRHAYDDGSVQETTERVLAWVATVDNNGEFPCGFFDTNAHKPTELGLGNYRGWVRKNQPAFGGTNLYDALVTGAKMAAEALNAPQILDLIMAEVSGGGSRGLFGRSSGNGQQVGLNEDGRGKYILPLQNLKPVQTKRLFHLTVITDGGPNEGPRPFREAIRELIVRLSYCGVFIKFIYVGNDPDGRDFLELLDDMPVAKHPNDLADEDADDDPRAGDIKWVAGARYIDNVDKVEFPQGLRHVSDEKFAGAMTQELDTYVPCAVRRSLVTMDNVALL